MAAHNDLGEKGEEMAAEWLAANGYNILHRNWRYKYYEIDIIAGKNDTLHIIEVKIRNHSRYGLPEDSVTKKKFRSLKRATDEYLFLNPNTKKWLEYGILAITLFDDRLPEFYFLEDVYL
jgi:putative endonuclease